MIAQVRAAGKVSQRFPWKTGLVLRDEAVKLESNFGNLRLSPCAEDNGLRPAERIDFKSRIELVEESRRSCFLAEPGSARLSEKGSGTLPQS